ncbi:hypothetical protein ACFQ1M_00800 [Sungkyunkwania multivorans]|uniref:Lipocalin-like domain-containing protein n=1 Tax=Sungkyunkwania multivorans TaxID=1173618 RepID=A0ABW3CSI4_9FLAO
MKNSLLAISLLISALLSYSCSDDDNAQELVSKWKLTEQLADPGDGSGEFEPVSIDRTLSFYADGTVTSDGDLCVLFLTNENSSSGTYTSEHILPANCVSSDYRIVYEIENDELLLYFPCFEPCVQKYRRIPSTLIAL